MTMTATTVDSDRDRLRLRHLRIGWWSLLLFALLGILLEAMHAWKAELYLHPAAETRRLLWRLAHAHGLGLAMVHVAFAVTIGHAARLPRAASPCLIGASVALPGGFFLGGAFASGGDPGLGIVAVPLGALLLLVAILGTARSLRDDAGNGGTP